MSLFEVAVHLRGEGYATRYFRIEAESKEIAAALAREQYLDLITVDAYPAPCDPGTEEQKHDQWHDRSQPGDTISVLLDGNKSADLQVEEFHPYEPSAYVLDPGWTCYDLNTNTEYFVNRAGDVFVQPENCVVGVCPALAAQYEEMLERYHDE